MAAVRAAAFHVGIGGIGYVAFGLCFTGSAGMGTVAMCPAVLGRASLCAAAFSSTTVMAVVVASASSTVSAVALIAALVLVVVVIDLGLERGNRGCEGGHLFKHLLGLLGGVSHVAEVVLHLLLSDAVGGDDGTNFLLVLEAFDDLVDYAGGGCIGLFMVSKGICGYCGLTLFDCFLGGFKVSGEVLPGLVSLFFIVPFSNVAREDCGSGNDDDADVDELGCGLCGVGCVGHVGIGVYVCEDVDNWAGVVVGCGLDGGFGGGERLGCDVAVGVEEGLEDFWNRSFEEARVVID